MCILE